MLLHLPGTAGAIAVALGRARLYGSTFLPITNSLLASRLRVSDNFLSSFLHLNILICDEVL